MRFGIYEEYTGRHRSIEIRVVRASSFQRFSNLIDCFFLLLSQPNHTKQVSTTAATSQSSDNLMAFYSRKQCRLRNKSGKDAMVFFCFDNCCTICCSSMPCVTKLFVFPLNCLHLWLRQLVTNVRYWRNDSLCGLGRSLIRSLCHFMRLEDASSML